MLSSKNYHVGKNKESIKWKIIEFIWRRRNEANLWNSFIYAMSNCHIEDES